MILSTAKGLRGGSTLFRWPYFDDRQNRLRTMAGRSLGLFRTMHRTSEADLCARGHRAGFQCALPRSPSDPLFMLQVNPADMIKGLIWNSPVDVKHLVPQGQTVQSGCLLRLERLGKRTLRLRWVVRC